jgi:beta-mannanase
MLSWLRSLWIPGSIFLLLILIGEAVPPRASTGAFPLKLDRTSILFGAYDPKETLHDVPGVKLEHVFVNWNGPVRERLDEISTRAKELGRDLLLSVEPWARPQDTDPARYYKAIMAGEYDTSIVELCDGVARIGSAALIRWGHEMDAPNGRYSWNLDPQDFIDIYRHFVDRCRPHARNALFVWSPRGDPGYEQFYPGDEYVDLSGLTLFGLEPWEVANYGHPRSFTEAFAEKYEPVERIGKKVLLTEFGVCGDANYRQSWLTSALNSERRFPLLAGVIYFNDREPHLWPAVPNYDSQTCEPDSPDWRISLSG